MFGSRTRNQIFLYQIARAHAKRVHAHVKLVRRQTSCGRKSGAFVTAAAAGGQFGQMCVFTCPKSDKVSAEKEPAPTQYTLKG